METEVEIRLAALGSLIGGLRERLDAQLKLTRNWFEGVEAKLTRLEARLDELERNRHVPAWHMTQIEKSSREEAPHGED